VSCLGRGLSPVPQVGRGEEQGDGLVSRDGPSEQPVAALKSPILAEIGWMLASSGA
jgi:hypothetical protein